LALFAFALQILLSFGHVHLYGFALASAEPSPSVAMDSSGVSPEAQDRIHKSNGSSDVDCPICALIQLAATSVPSAAPAFPLPEKVDLSRLEAPAALPLAASPHSLFRARGPPSV
jgi:hypothetical protein